MANRKWRYMCDSCDWHGEYDKKKKYFASYECPYCKKGYILDKTEDPEIGLHVFVKQEPKTLGHLAGRNTDTIGRAKMEDKEFAYKEGRRKAAQATADAAGGKLIERDKTAKPWWRDGTIPGVKKYDKATDLPVIKNNQKYIETGET